MADPAFLTNNNIKPGNQNSPVQNPPEKKGGLFSSSSKPKVDDKKEMTEMFNQVNNLSRRVRMVEERQSSIRTKAQIVEANMVDTDKKLMSEIKSTNEEIRTLKHELNDLRGDIKLIIKELQSCSKKEDVKVLEKYINIWEPVNFVTQDQVVNMVKDNIIIHMDDINMKLQQEQYVDKVVTQKLKQLLESKTKVKK